MPHKHRRTKSASDASFWDLPPSKNARPLSVRKTTTEHPAQLQKKFTKRNRDNFDDDTPRAFTRLLGIYRSPRSGLDDGIRTSKRRKIPKPSADDKAITQTSLPLPTILPNEPLSAFNARVDTALPISNLSKNSGGRRREGGEGRKTKTEKKMQRMQREWREEERRRKEKLEAERDEAVVDGDSIVDTLNFTKKTRRKGSNKKRGGRDDSERPLDIDDDGAHVRGGGGEQEDEARNRGLIGLHDVAMAPPKLSKISKLRKRVNLGQG